MFFDKPRMTNNKPEMHNYKATASVIKPVMSNNKTEIVSKHPSFPVLVNKKNVL
jgi:hypothetical protein